MALIYFQERINIVNAEVPEPGGFLIGYDIADGVLKQKDSNGNITLVGSKGINVIDSSTGIQFTDIQNITFKGGFVTTPNGISDGVSVKEQNNDVTVWIPSPSYVDNFNPVLYSNFIQRYISLPTNNTYNPNVQKGDFSIGDWDVSTDFLSQTRNVVNENQISITDDEFSCINNETLIDFTVYDGFNNSIASITGFVVEQNNTLTNQNLTLIVNSFNPDSDRFKADITATIDLLNLLPNGGRFYYEITHNNGSEGSYTFTSDQLFKESPSTQDLTTSTSVITGSVNFAEDTPNIKYYSGVAFYGINSTFQVDVQDIDFLNEITIPTDKQVDLISNNIPTTSTYEALGSDITNWTINWNAISLNYLVTSNINEVGIYFPDFATDNIIPDNITSFFTSNIYDYGLVESKTSNELLTLFDTTEQTLPDTLNNDLTSENSRLSTDQIQTDGSASFDSTTPLSQDELQFIFGRIIYPNQDFSNLYPNVNIGNSAINYTSSNASNKIFDVYTDFNTIDSTPLLFEEYRWFTTSYEKDNSFSNGTFNLGGNFTESDLHFDPLNSTPGSEDLVILVGIDSSDFNNTPDTFMFLSGDINTYSGRQDFVNNNLDSVDSSKSIKFNKGLLPTIIKKVWLLIGFKNSVRGKELYLDNISFS